MPRDHGFAAAPFPHAHDLSPAVKIQLTHLPPRPPSCPPPPHLHASRLALRTAARPVAARSFTSTPVVALEETVAFKGREIEGLVDCQDGMA